MSNQLIVLCGSVLLATSAAAQAPETLGSPDLQWKEMIPGVSFAPAFGDWERGAHGKFVRIAPGGKVPPHTHSQPYHAVFVSGRLANSVNGAAAAEVRSGEYWHMAGGRVHAHECVSDEPCFFYTHSTGPWDVQLVEKE